MDVITLIKIRRMLKNPISIFFIAGLFVTFVLACCTNMQAPDFYTNRALAERIAQEVSYEQTFEATEHLINPYYGLFNGLYQIWAWLLIIFAFCLIFRVNNFMRFSELKVLNRKLFAYLWVNLSYLIFAYCFLNAFMTDIAKFVYNGSQDSFGIPYVSMCLFLIMFAIIYYPFANFLVFITYNTKVRRIFYNFLWFISLLIILFFALICYDFNFSVPCFGLDACMLVWFIFSIYAIGYKKS